MHQQRLQADKLRPVCPGLLWTRAVGYNRAGLRPQKSPLYKPMKWNLMPKAKQSSTAPTNDGAIVGYEARLWQMADALRGSMDAAEYKHVVLGLIFLKYISDAFEAQHAQ